MSLNRTAKGIVLVPSLLLGGAFIAAAAWVDGPAAENRILALVLGGALVGAGLLAQLLPESRPEITSQQDSMPPSPDGVAPSPKA
jgi:hypothetical protein